MWTCDNAHKLHTCAQVPDGYHDLHHDPETPECVERMVNWLRTSMQEEQEEQEEIEINI